MNFQFIDVDLCESVLYYKSAGLSRFTGREIADGLYLNTLGLYLLYLDKETAYAKKYAKKTRQFGTYALFRTHATDIYLLCYQILHPDNDHITMNNPIESKVLLNTMQLDRKYHLRFMQMLSIEDVNSATANSYFLRLETQLKISQSRYKLIRRNIVDWHSLSRQKQHRIITLLYAELRRQGNGSGIRSEIAQKLKELQE